MKDYKKELDGLETQVKTLMDKLLQLMDEVLDDLKQENKGDK